MPEEDYEFTPSPKLMQIDEIEAIAKIFVGQGVNKIRLTGGEPLVRKGAEDIILRLSKLPVNLTLTTNATRLHEFVDVLEQANVRSLNISLDTLQPEKFQLITRRNLFGRIVETINLLIAKDFHVKVNVVVMKGLNDNEINDFIEWTKDTNVHVRFIEFMPFESNRWTSRAENHKGTFAVISTMSAPFCSGCNRMRLTADGKMKNCLFSQKETDLLIAFRKGEDILPMIIESIRSKEKELGGQFTKDFTKIHTEDIHNRSMIAIGG
jgi:cyclic pyranopterin phosphate synthase